VADTSSGARSRDTANRVRTSTTPSSSSAHQKATSSPGSGARTRSSSGSAEARQPWGAPDSSPGRRPGQSSGGGGNDDLFGWPGDDDYVQDRGRAPRGPADRGEYPGGARRPDGYPWDGPTRRSPVGERTRKGRRDVGRSNLNRRSRSPIAGLGAGGPYSLLEHDPGTASFQGTQHDPDGGLRFGDATLPVAVGIEVLSDVSHAGVDPTHIVVAQSRYPGRPGGSAVPLDRPESRRCNLRGIG
jgi:hypothetical protein